jgi:predicted enzyme related to lactoylglutathione lyase
MAKVLGVGGVYFKSPDPRALRAWYARWLGMFADDVAVTFHPDTMPPGSSTAWSPFPRDTRALDPSDADFMISFVVDDLEAMLDRLDDSGAQVTEEIEELPHGRFGWFVDPDGNKVELWEPPKA